MKIIFRAPAIATLLLCTSLLLLVHCMESLDEGVPEQINDYASTVTVNGRVFYIAQPSTPPPPGGYPVVFCFHGGDGSGRMWLDLSGFGLSGFGNTALARGYFVVAPDAGISDDPSGSYNDVKKRWDTAIASGDIPYVLDIINWLAASGYDVNMDRLFGVGISSGGAMISRLSQNVPFMFRRVTIVASLNPSYGYIDTGGVQIINASHPSVLFIHGTADTSVPYVYGEDYYQSLTGLSSYATVAAANGQVSARVFITVPGGGHIWFRDYNNDIIDWFNGAP